MDCTSPAVPQTSNSLSVQCTRATHVLTIDYTTQLNQSSASNPRAVGIFIVVMAKCEIEKKSRPTFPDLQNSSFSVKTTIHNLSLNIFALPNGELKDHFCDLMVIFLMILYVSLCFDLI